MSSSYLDGAVRLVRELDRNALYELDLDVGARVGGALRAHGHLEHVLLVRHVRLLEAPRLVAGVEQVLVDGVVALGLGVDRDAVLGAVRQQVLPPLEALDELRVAPRGDAPDLRVEGLRAHLEADLVVALPGRAVGDVTRPLGLGYADHLLGDAGTGHGRAEEVPPLVDGVALERLEDVVLDELLPEVGDHALDGAAGDGLGLDGLEVLVVLADVGAEGHDLEALLAEPLEDDGRVEAAGVGEDHFRLGLGRHGSIKLDWRSSDLKINESGTERNGGVEEIPTDCTCTVARTHSVRVTLLRESGRGVPRSSCLLLLDFSIG